MLTKRLNARSWLVTDVYAADGMRVGILEECGPRPDIISASLYMACLISYATATGLLYVALYYFVLLFLFSLCKIVPLNYLYDTRLDFWILSR